MARAYPGDFRTRVLEARRAGASAGEISRVLAVSPRTIYRWERQDRLTGSVEPRTAPGREPAIRSDQRPLLRAQVDEHADATLAEHCQVWAETTGRLVGTSTMWRALETLGLRRKKRV